jgi:hypothetical protein
MDGCDHLGAVGRSDHRDIVERAQRRDVRRRCHRADENDGAVREPARGAGHRLHVEAFVEGADVDDPGRREPAERRRG